MKHVPRRMTRRRAVARPQPSTLIGDPSTPTSAAAGCAPPRPTTEKNSPRSKRWCGRKERRLDRAHRRFLRQRLANRKEQVESANEPEDLPPVGPDELLGQLLARLPTDAAIWRELTARFDVQLRFGIFLDESNRGFELDPKHLAQLTVMGATLLFDLYAQSSS
jgi:hypothetical protein